MINLLDLTGKTILIAGAALGIGRETAVTLSRLGASLVLMDLNLDELKTTMELLDGEGHSFIQFDAGKSEKIEELVKSLVIANGPFDGFVYCVGVRSRRPVAMITPDLFLEVMALNTGSFLELVRNLAKKGHFRQGMSVVGISSVASSKGGAGITAYAASKAAMDAVVRCLARELAPKGIRLNTVVPGQINTHAYNEFLQMSGGIDPAMSRQYLGLGEPSDVAGMIAFLLSNSSRLITGNAFPVDGGFLSS